MHRPSGALGGVSCHAAGQCACSAPTTHSNCASQGAAAHYGSAAAPTRAKELQATARPGQPGSTCRPPAYNRRGPQLPAWCCGVQPCPAPSLKLASFSASQLLLVQQGMGHIAQRHLTQEEAQAAAQGRSSAPACARWRHAARQARQQPQICAYHTAASYAGGCTHTYPAAPPLACEPTRHSGATAYPLAMHRGRCTT